MKFKTNFLNAQNQQLFLEKSSAEKLAAKFGTPLYAYSQTQISENLQNFLNALQALPNSALFYAVKANNNLNLLNLIRKSGLGADAANPLEIALAKKVGFPRTKILYSGVFHSKSELRAGLKSGVAINLDSLSALQRLLELGRPKVLSLRVNPGIGKGKFQGLVTAGKQAKFGLSPADILLGYRQAQKAGIQRFGLHAMTGSCVLNSDYFPAVAEKLLTIANEIEQKLTLKFEFLDLGGGFGIPYEPREKALNLKLTFRKIQKVCQNFQSKFRHGLPKLIFEPGRAISGNAGILLTRVTTCKNLNQQKFVGVDAGMQTLLRPALYGAYHEILNATHLNRKPRQRVAVVGPICENTDFLATRVLPQIQENDLLAILDVGAYGFGMASQYNTRPRPAEVLVKGSKVQLIRPAEGLAEIIGQQRLLK